ncbi:unnamed protein product [Clonostachys rosea f. rosea IK726]|uniref:Uncharacterized protein n=1 Tax=Clonostachys rosea f. rosea IK726 TaxID=1349383 RepID=A0ACA9UT09_BIOOC|nr:unnamed protein product [Clonostachys rosea f. rosea IK726]
MQYYLQVHESRSVDYICTRTHAGPLAPGTLLDSPGFFSFQNPVMPDPRPLILDLIIKKRGSSQS